MKSFVILTALLSISLLQACGVLENSPEGDHYTVTDSTQIYLVNIGQDSIKRLADGVHPLFLSKTERVLYGNRDSLLTIQFDGKNESLVAYIQGADFNSISISKDEQTALVVANNGAYNSLIKVDLNNGVTQSLTDSTSKYISSPKFYLHDSRIIYWESRAGKSILSSIDVNGNAYQRVPTDSSFFLFIGSTDDDNILAMETYYSYPESSASTISLLDPVDFTVQDTIILHDRIVPNLSAKLTNDMKLCYSSSYNNLYELDLSTKRETTLFQGSVGDAYAISDDLKIAVLAGNEIQLIDLIARTQRSYLLRIGIGWYLYANISHDNRYFAVVKYIHTESF